MLLFFALAIAPTASGEEHTAGFLVVAPDRGFLGNQEVRTVFDEFKSVYPRSALAFVGRDYNGIGSEYSEYLHRAISELKQAAASEVIALPLFLSNADPVLAKVTAHLPAYPGAKPIRWAPPMADSYLIGQALLDRVEALSREPEQERLVLVGFGANNQASEIAMRADLEKLLRYITRYKRFKEARVVLYYDRAAAEADKKNKEADQAILETAAKEGRTLAVLAAIGPKFDQTMALTTRFGDQFSELDVAYGREELLPHPNVLLWLKKTANSYLSASSSEIGVVIMPHGATQPYNDAVESVITPMRSRYRIEMAYGMGDPTVIQQAVSRLEQQGVRRIIFVRMYALAHHLKDRTEYILGLSDTAASGHDDHDHIPPPQIRSAALFITFGGYEEYPRIAEVLHARIVEVSTNPAHETVILVSHGDKSDEANAQWLSIMNANIERLRKDPHCSQLKAIHAATVREDWPEKRETAVAEVRRLIQESAQTGSVLLIADRLYGSGPYKKLFNGLDFTLNEKGLVHPVLANWLDENIGQIAVTLARPLAPPAHPTLPASPRTKETVHVETFSPR